MKLHRTRWSVTAAAFAATAVVAAPAQATFPGKSGKIVYSSPAGQNWDVFSIAPDGSGAQKLLGPHDTSAVWSPGGKKLAFHSRRGFVSLDVWTANADGSGQVRLTDSPAQDSVPDWSPDGRKIAFNSTRDGGANEVYVMNADGSGQTRLTNDPGNDIQPAFSPDGRKIAFARTSGIFVNVWIMNADGSGATQLTNDVASSSPNWSPDGKTIAYNSSRGGFNDLWLMDAGGANQRRLATPTGGIDRWPAWSPDGKRIAFTRLAEDSSREELFVMNRDGTQEVKLTTSPALVFNREPDWQSLPRPKPKPKRRLCLLGICLG